MRDSLTCRNTIETWLNLNATEEVDTWLDSDPSIRDTPFEFWRISASRVVYGRRYRSRMFLGVILNYFGATQVHVVGTRHPYQPKPKCWRNRWNPFINENNLRSDNDLRRRERIPTATFLPVLVSVCPGLGWFRVHRDRFPTFPFLGCLETQS